MQLVLKVGEFNGVIEFIEKVQSIDFMLEKFKFVDDDAFIHNFCNKLYERDCLSPCYKNMRRNMTKGSKIFPEACK